MSSESPRHREYIVGCVHLNYSDLSFLVIDTNDIVLEYELPLVEV